MTPGSGHGAAVDATRQVCAILFIWSAIACRNAAPNTDIVAERERETLELYSAAFTYLHADESADTIYVERQTVAYDGRVREPAAMDPLKSVSPEMANSFLRANATSAQLPRAPRIPAHVVVLLDSLSTVWRETGRHPVVRFSKPGVNTSRDSAVVFVSRNCGPLCGAFKLVLLVRDRGKWKGVDTLWNAYTESREYKIWDRERAI